MSLARFIGPVSALVVFATPATLWADEAKLRYSYPTEPLTYRLITKVENESSGAMLGPTPIKNGLGTIALCQLKKVGADGDSTKVELVYKALKFRQDTPGGRSVFFDSSSPEFREAKPESMDVMSRLMSSLFKQPIVLTIDPRGQITKIANLQALHETAKEIGATDTLSQALFETMIGDEKMMDTFRELFVTLPEEALKPGSTWTTTASAQMPIAGSIKRTTTWTHAPAESAEGRNTVRLKGTTTAEASTEEKAKSGRPPGADVHLDAKEAKGGYDVVFDPKAGIVRSVSYTMTTPITMNVKVQTMNDKAAQGMSMTMKGTNSGMAMLVSADAPLDPENTITKPQSAPAKPVPATVAPERKGPENMEPAH